MHQFKPVKTLQDINKVVSLAEQIWNAHYAQIISQAQIEYMLTRFQSSEAIHQQLKTDQDYFLLEYNQQAIAYFSLITEPSNHRIKISKLYLLIQYQSQGLGKKILNYIEKTAQNRQIDTLYLTVNKHNIKAIRFYQKSGFSNQGPIVQTIGQGFIMDDYLMEKTLSPL